MQQQAVWAHASEHRDVCSRGGTKNVSCLSCSFLDEPFICLFWEVWIICLIGALLIYDQCPGERKPRNYFPSHFVSFTDFLNQSLLDWRIQLFIFVGYPYNISPGFLNCFHQLGFTCVSISFSWDEIFFLREEYLGPIISHFMPEHKICFLLLEPAGVVYSTFCSKSTRKLLFGWFVCLVVFFAVERNLDG